MAFELKRKECVGKGVKRLGKRQARKALHALGNCERLEAVHEVRKKIKELRALLRLARAVLHRSDYRRCAAVLRKAAGQLAAARDAHVKVNALADLASHFKRKLSPGPFSQLHSLLAADCRREQAALSKARTPAKVGRFLREFCQDLAAAETRGSGWAALAPGLKRSYRDGRRGYQLVCQQPTPERFHEWRKRVKDLLYELEVLCPIWPEQMAAAQAELKRLGEYLGDDHDFFLLTQPGLAKRLRQGDEPAAEVLKGLVSSRQQELRAQALELGARFFEEKPAAFCKRLGQYWKRWRYEPKRMARAR